MMAPCSSCCHGHHGSSSVLHHNQAPSQSAQTKDSAWRGWYLAHSYSDAFQYSRLPGVYQTSPRHRHTDTCHKFWDAGCFLVSQDTVTGPARVGIRNNHHFLGLQHQLSSLHKRAFYEENEPLVFFSEKHLSPSFPACPGVSCVEHPRRHHLINLSFSTQEPPSRSNSS